MKTMLISFLLAFSAQSYALTLNDLHAGDVLALSFNCYECRVIESETDSAFSHTGVVIVDEAGNKRVAQSLGKLDHYSYEQFTKPMTPGTRVHVYRPVEFKNLSEGKRQQLEKNMLDVFNEKYKGAPFDSRYLWNNFDSKGRELLYCSEFIAKFLDNFLSQKTIPMPLTYDKNYAYWLTYFRGDVPEGELGNGPASFSRDSRFEFVGTL